MKLPLFGSKLGNPKYGWLTCLLSDLFWILCYIGGGDDVYVLCICKNWGWNICCLSEWHSVMQVKVSTMGKMGKQQSKRLSSFSSSCWSFSNMLQASPELSETKSRAPQTGWKQWQGLGVLLLWQGLRFFTRLSKIYMLTGPGGVSSPMWRLRKQTSIKVLLALLPPTSTILYTTVQ